MYASKYLTHFNHIFVTFGVQIREGDLTHLGTSSHKICFFCSPEQYIAVIYLIVWIQAFYTCRQCLNSVREL